MMKALGILDLHLQIQDDYCKDVGLQLELLPVFALLFHLQTMNPSESDVRPCTCSLHKS